MSNSYLILRKKNSDIVLGGHISRARRLARTCLYFPMLVVSATLIFFKISSIRDTFNRKIIGNCYKLPPPSVAVFLTGES